MATLCKNCGHTLIFDPISQKMECEACGSSFLPEEIEAESKQYRQDEKIESMEEIYGQKDADFIDCYVYTCSQCGGEIIINGTEASTNCIYCGKPNVVFSRIARQKAPEVILPFSISKEKALELVRNRVNKGLFIPKEIKNFTVDSVRGIYIPYWIINASYTDSVVIQGTVKRGKSSTTRYYGRAGKLNLHNIPFDASTTLSDESSQRLEPFDLKGLKDFDEDYLAGFYSNISDVKYGELRRNAFKRAKEYFDEEAINDVKGASSKKIVSSLPSLSVDNKMSYAMLPAWFITFDYKGKHNTILVNGDTGKIVCGLPWNKALFYTMLVILSILLTVAFFFVFKFTFPYIFSSRHSSSNNDNGKLIIGLIAGTVALFVTGVHKIRKVVKNINLTQDKDIFNFTKKRQE